MNTQTDLAELRRLWEAATPGEWALAWEGGKTGVLASMIGKLVAFIGNPDPSDGYEPTRKANGEFIAAAHNALPALLDELEAAREEVRRLNGIISGAKNVACAYCQHVTKAEGLTDDEIRDRVLEHTVNCDQRPEAGLLMAMLFMVHAVGMNTDGLPKNSPELFALKFSDTLDARDRRMKLIGAAEEWELEAGIAKAAGRDLITYQREYLEQRAAKLRQEAEGNG